MEIQNEVLSKELNEIRNTYDKKCAALKTLKGELDTTKKENNSLGVALKRSKKENSETVQSYEKKIREYEDKMVELIEYKKQKMIEERDLKLKLRKETKKAQQKLKKEKAENRDIETNSDSNQNDVIPSALNYKPFDIINNKIIEENSLSSFVPNSSDPVPDPHTLSSTTTIATTSSTNITTNMFTESLMSKPDTAEVEVTGTTGDTFSETNKAAILAALQIFSNNMDKCIEEIRR